jgi:hypothetical protein
MRDVIEFMIFIWLLIFTLAVAICPSSRDDLEGKNVVIHQDTLMITSAQWGDKLQLSNGAEISVELAEKYLID